MRLYEDIEETVGRELRRWFLQAADLAERRQAGALVDAHRARQAVALQIDRGDFGNHDLDARLHVDDGIATLHMKRAAESNRLLAQAAADAHLSGYVERIRTGWWKRVDGLRQGDDAGSDKSQQQPGGNQNRRNSTPETQSINFLPPQNSHL